MRDEFGAKNPKSLMLRFHTQTAGVQLTAQQPEVNMVRVAVQALAAVLGGTVVRLRQYPVVKAVFEGGLHRLKAMPEGLAREMYQVGNRPGHYLAFMSLVQHWPTWEAVRERYGDIVQPVLLLYGDHDWSRPDERAETARRIAGAEVRTVANAGHFLSFDALVAILVERIGGPMQPGA